MAHCSSTSHHLPPSHCVQVAEKQEGKQRMASVALCVIGLLAVLFSGKHNGKKT